MLALSPTGLCDWEALEKNERACRSSEWLQLKPEKELEPQDSNLKELNWRKRLTDLGREIP